MAGSRAGLDLDWIECGGGYPEPSMEERGVGKNSKIFTPNGEYGCIHA